MRKLCRKGNIVKYAYELCDCMTLPVLDADKKIQRSDLEDVTPQGCLQMLNVACKGPFGALICRGLHSRVGVA